VTIARRGKQNAKRDLPVALDVFNEGSCACIRKIQ
jgi:hypothetical protein